MRKHRAPFAAIALFFFAWQSLPALADEGDAALERGMRLFNSGELKAAEKMLERAVGLLPPGKGRAKAHLHLGLTRAYLEKFAAAKREFVRALTEDPTTVVDTERVPPPVRQAFEEARSTVTGTLVLEGGPKGARAEIDGKDRGPLPHRSTLLVGEHKVRVLAADGRAISTETLALRAGERRVVRIVAETVRVPVIVAQPKPTPIAVLPPKPRETPKEPAVEPIDPKTISEPLASLPPLPTGPQRVEEGAESPLAPESGDAWFTKRRIAGLVTTSAGVLSAFLGLGFGLAAKGAENDFRRAVTEGTNFSEVLRLQSDAQSRARTSNILLTVGAGVFAAGLVFTLWPAKSERPAAKLAATPSGAVLALEF